jgi:hypothetical protein
MDATFKQRKALFNIYSALHWDYKLKTIRTMTVDEASTAIADAQKYIDEHGFPERDDNSEEPT